MRKVAEGILWQGIRSAERNEEAWMGKQGCLPKAQSEQGCSV